MWRWFGCSLGLGHEGLDHDDKDSVLSARADDADPIQVSQDGNRGRRPGTAAMRALEPGDTVTAAGTFDELPEWSMVRKRERSMRRLLSKHLDRSISPPSASLVALTLPLFTSWTHACTVIHVHQSLAQRHCCRLTLRAACMEVTDSECCSGLSRGPCTHLT